MKPFNASKTEQRLLIATISLAGPLMTNKYTELYLSLKNTLITSINEIKDWRGASAYLIKKGIAPALWYIISKDTEIEAIIPEKARTIFKQTYMKTLTRSMILYNSFSEIINELNNRQIKVVALKGIYLAEALYPLLGLRQLSDIDLLIKEDDADNVLKIMKKLGYRLTESLYSKLVSETLEYAHLPALVKNSVSVELHLKLHANLYDYKLNTIEFMNRSIKKSISGNELYVLEPIDMLIHLCVHLDKHFNGSELQFYSWLDIVILLWNNDIDMEVLMDRSDNYGAKKNVIKQLMLINHVFKTPALSISHESYKLNKSIMRQLQLQLNENASNISSINAHRSYIKSIPGFKSKIMFIGEIFFPSKKLILAVYDIHSPRLYWLWYPYRWWKIITSAVNSINFRD